MGDYSGGGGGITPPAGDIGGTTADPTVVSTHLTSPLPLAQGGTGVDGATTPVNFRVIQSVPSSGVGEVDIGYNGSINAKIQAYGSVYGYTGIQFNFPGSSNNIVADANALRASTFAETVFQADMNTGIVSALGNATSGPVYTTADVVSGTALQISTTRDAIVSLDITYSTTSANTILVQTGPTSTPANTVYKKVKTTSTAEEDTIMVDVKAGEYLLVTLTNATFTNATQVVKLV